MVVELLYVAEIFEPGLVGRQLLFQLIEDRHAAVVLGRPFVDILEVSCETDRAM